MIYDKIYEKLWFMIKFIKLMISKIFMKSYKSYEKLWFVKYLWKVIKVMKSYKSYEKL
jgi:hypothetical protein